LQLLQLLLMRIHQQKFFYPSNLSSPMCLFFKQVFINT